MKKHLFLLLLAMLMAIAPARAYGFSAEAPSGQTLYYNINGDEVTLTCPGSNSWSGFTTPGGDLTIPPIVTDAETGNRYTVTSIGNYAFYNCTGLTSVNIPSSVNSIGDRAFYGCNGLTSVTFASPSSLISIGSYAFYNCTGLPSVTIPNSVTSIGNYAFANVPTVIYCGSAQQGSPWGANNAGCFYPDEDFIYFDNTKDVLVGYQGTDGDVTIPNSVTSIGNRAFSGCTRLTSVTIGRSVTSIGNEAFSTCRNLTSVDIPNSVISIGEQAFINCSGLPSVTIPVSVTSIGISAFSGCSGLTSVSIPSSVTSISNSAFNGCTGLTSVTILGSVATIGNNAFRNCSSLNSVDIPGSVTSIGNDAFYMCSGLTSVTIPNSVTSIGNQAFCNCSGLTSVTIGSSVTSIGNEAFSTCRNLTSVTIGNSVTSIGDKAFYNCTGLTSVTIPSSVTSIGSSAFNGCTGLTSVTIPSSVTSIGSSAFKGCSGLTSVTIPNSVTNIGDKAFYNCSSLKTVYNLSSSLTLTPGSNGNGYVAKYAKRVVKPTKFGTGTNAIYQIPDTYTIVSNETDEAAKLPESTISEHYNFIYKNNGSWISKKIVLTDCSDAFNTPVGFTAASVTYTRTLTDGNRSTLCLPFTTTIPAELEVYEFTSFDANTIHFTQKESGNIVDYTPYLVGKDLSKSTTDFTFTQTNAVFTATPASMTPVTHNEMTFRGVMERTKMTSTNNYGYKDGFFVRSGGSAHVNPFRCYFTWDNAPQGAPQSLGVDTDGGGVGIEQPAADDAAQNGRIRYSNDVYDLMGRMVRKEASDLRGLPKGIYIWRGKKVMAF